MDTLAYFHLVIAYETSVNTETVSAPEDRRKSSAEWSWLKFSTKFALRFLAVAVVLGIVGTAGEAMALQKGDRGPGVVALQHKLKKMGYFHGRVTGYYGTLTKHAVTAFQCDYGLPGIGIAGPRTHAALGLNYGSKHAGCHHHHCHQGHYRPAKHSHKSHHKYHPASYHDKGVGKGQRGYSVAKVQYRLKKLGYFHAHVTGYYGPITKHAVKAFQKDYGIKQTGYVGPLTKKALGLS